MRRKHGRRHRPGTGLVALAGLLLTLTLPTFAAELTVDTYVDLTIARLQLAYDTWSQEDRSPVETEEAAVCQPYDTDLDSYYAFAGSHRREIDDYLADHTDERDTIDSLAADIAAMIEQKEVQ